MPWDDQVLPSKWSREVSRQYAGWSAATLNRLTLGWFSRKGLIWTSGLTVVSVSGPIRAHGNTGPARYPGTRLGSRIAPANDSAPRRIAPSSFGSRPRPLQLSASR